MKTIQQLEQLIYSNEIKYDIRDMPDQILGYYQSGSSGDYILMNSSIEKDPIHFKCVLSEEIGHYFTTSGVNESRKCITYCTKVGIDKEEEKAIRWGIDFLIDTDLLLKYISNFTLATLDDLVDYFQVTEEFMLKKLDFMARIKLYWHVKDKHYLCLSNLPSVYMTTFFDTSLIDKM